jgi:hypothetical protein
LPVPHGPTFLPLFIILVDVGLEKINGAGPQPHDRMKQLGKEYGDVMIAKMGSDSLWLVLSTIRVFHEAFVLRGRDFFGRPMVPSMGLSSGGGKGFASRELTPELKI